MSFSDAKAVFDFLDQFVSADVWAIPKERRYLRLSLMAGVARNPQSCAKAFHVAGSKGKGSVTSMITALLAASGKKAAQYLSPHVLDPRERITLNGAFLEDGVYAKCGEETRSLYQRLMDGSNAEHSLFYGKDAGCYQPTYFELLTFYYFFCAKEAGADFLSVETGMGGRFDPTNVVSPLISIITVIEKEHTAFLGSTIEKIAGEKAGIIKEGRPVIVGKQTYKEALAVFRETAQKKNAPFYYLPEIVSVEDVAVSREGTTCLVVPKNGIFKRPLELRLSLVGEVYAQNAALASCALKIALPETDDAIIAKALSGIRSPARFEKLRDSPPVVVDGAHTELSAAQAAASWSALYGDGGILLFGCAGDKDARAMARVLTPHFKYIYVTAPSAYKESEPQKVAKIFEEEGAPYNAQVTGIEDTEAAIKAALGKAQKENLPLFCTGSFYLASALLSLNPSAI